MVAPRPVWVLNPGSVGALAPAGTVLPGLRSLLTGSSLRSPPAATRQLRRSGSLLSSEVVDVGQVARPTGFALVGDEVAEAGDVDGELVSELNSLSSTPTLLESHA